VRARCAGSEIRRVVAIVKRAGPGPRHSAQALVELLAGEDRLVIEVVGVWPHEACEEVHAEGLLGCLAVCIGNQEPLAEAAKCAPRQVLCLLRNPEGEVRSALPVLPSAGEPRGVLVAALVVHQVVKSQSIEFIGVAPYDSHHAESIVPRTAPPPKDAGAVSRYS
jgi:hypothetical protein